jgi:GNAT superfamily N-acetyltransferase
MRDSARGLFPAFYTETQTASGVEHIAHLDTMLVGDRTYFVHDHDGALVACGGWSRRGKLYAGAATDADDERLLDPRTEPARVRAMFVRPDWTRRGLGRALLRACEQAAAVEGFRELALMATLPGVPLYEACGYTAVNRVVITLPDNVEVGGVEMRRRIEG